VRCGVRAAIAYRVIVQSLLEDASGEPWHVWHHALGSDRTEIGYHGCRLQPWRLTVYCIHSCRVVSYTHTAEPLTDWLAGRLTGWLVT
jgi:hypothetical protein